MNIDLDIISASSLVVVPIIIAVVQAIKLTGWVPDKFAPIVSIAIGIIIGFIANHNLADISANLLSGVMYGLMASGLYSGVKVTMEAQKAKNYQSKKDNC
jgi:hypothetical protein